MGHKVDSCNTDLHKLFYTPLLNERNELIKERKKLHRSSKRYLEIGERLTTIKKYLKVEEENIVKKSQFVATTVSKAIVDPIIYKKNYDVVIFDEASMAYIPQIIFSASLAIQHFVCLGDFCQLPPIVQSHSNLLNQDIFEYCGITTAVQRNLSHNWLHKSRDFYHFNIRFAVTEFL